MTLIDQEYHPWNDDLWCDDPCAPEYCDHDDYEIDILTGRVSCYGCDHSWWATNDQIKAEAERQAAYFEWEAEQHRPWNRFKEWAKNQLRGLKILMFYGVKILWPLRHRPIEMDDEIPF